MTTAQKCRKTKSMKAVLAILKIFMITSLFWRDLSTSISTRNFAYEFKLAILVILMSLMTEKIT